MFFRRRKGWAIVSAADWRPVFHPSLLHDLPVGEVTEAAPAPPLLLAFASVIRAQPGGGPFPLLQQVEVARPGGRFAVAWPWVRGIRLPHRPGGTHPSLLVPHSRAHVSHPLVDTISPWSSHQPNVPSAERLVSSLEPSMYRKLPSRRPPHPWWPCGNTPSPMARSMDRRSHTRPLPCHPISAVHQPYHILLFPNPARAQNQSRVFPGNDVGTRDPTGAKMQHPSRARDDLHLASS